MEDFKMPINAIKSVNCIAKKQKAANGLKFGDRENELDHAISTAVKHDNSDDLIVNPKDITQYEIQIDDELPTDDHATDEDAIDNNDAIESNDDTDDDLVLNNNINNANNICSDINNDDKL